MKVTIYFDMDGTIADLYNVDGWLEMLQAKDSLPYQMAEVMMNMSLLARYLNKLQKLGYKLGVISWLSKANDPEYNEAVTDAKLSWLEQHLPSVQAYCRCLFSLGRVFL